MMAKRVLVVDDTPAVLDTMRSVLGEKGYEVHTCLESRRAVPRAREVLPHVVILDIVMPELSGWQVLEMLRAEAGLGQVPVIICTAYPEPVLARMKELEGKRVGLLPKPFEVEELLELVAAAVEEADPGPEVVSG